MMQGICAEEWLLNELPIYVPHPKICHMAQYQCCKRHMDCPLYPVCAQSRKPTVCIRDCPNCAYEGCSLTPQQRISEPVYVDHVIQGEQLDLRLEIRRMREQSEHKVEHRKRYVYYNRLFGDYRERRNKQNRERYWRDPEFARQRAREWYQKHYVKKGRSIDQRFLPECNLQCEECRYPDCILPEDWLKRAYQDAFLKSHPDYFANYRETHREELREKGRAYHAANREKRLEWQHQYRQQPEVKRKKAAYDAAYRQTEAGKASSRRRKEKYYAAHRDEINAKRRAKRAAERIARS